MSEDHSPYIRWDLSIGNILTMLAMGITAAIAWGSMNERSDATHKGIKELEMMQSASDTRIRALEMNQTRTDERLNSILQIVSRIETRLEKEGHK
jgi:hypothetical protein